jgi:hypothetical protein
MGTDKAPWQYADFGSADRKLKALAEDQDIVEKISSRIYKKRRGNSRFWLIVEG